KEELLNAVWGDAVVTDSSLTRTIAQLRRLLGDEIRNPRYIETVATVGYRWMCKIEVAMEPSKDDDKLAPDPIVPVAEEKNESKGLQSSRWAIPSAVVLAILILAGIWIVGHRKGTVSSIRSLAVIPLDNLSGDPRQEYFADGMSDELIAMLAKDSTLRITSRTSVMQFKGAHRPLQEIARALNVDAILEGINLALR
ncbi:MAG TPA: winged helix-turn-helix domain-containing protein, partial [Terracidiphilus sp.]|nr:winged helix-turn-helix domain-containing protein [Terracidiphilus sp.]